MTQHYDWYVRLPDAPNTQKTRLENRSAHLDHARRQVEAGSITMRGDIVSGKSADDGNEGANVVGTVHVVRAGSEKEVWELLNADPYAKLAVWDLELATVAPMMVGIMKPL